MILKGSQRGGARQLATHLLRTDENDHIELHDIRGFMADDLQGALTEAHAVSKGTRCQQFLFSLSLSPPETEQVPVEVFEAAIVQIEAKLGLSGQPRALVFHEKQGRRHAHCAWSRIDADTMTAINLPHFKLKLRDVSRQLYIEHGWHMPAGLVNSAEADPRNFTRAEWQQAKRADRDPRELKEAFQDCWAISDSRKAFAQALAARGLYLARGDRRGFVAVDIRGEVYAVAKWTGRKAKEVEARLGDPAELPSVEETKGQIAELLQGTLGRHLTEAEAEHQVRVQPLIDRRIAMRREQRAERQALKAAQSSRSVDEARERAQRFRRGIGGVWDRLTGRSARITRENETAAVVAVARDRAETLSMIQAQLRDRRMLQRELRQVVRVHAADVAAIPQEMQQILAERNNPRLRLEDGSASDERPPQPKPERTNAMNKRYGRRNAAEQDRPTTPTGAEARLRSYGIKMFEREEGREADWSLIAQTMFATAFAIIDEAKGKDEALAVLRRVEASAYNRLVRNEDDNLPPVISTETEAGPAKLPIRTPALRHRM